MATVATPMTTKEMLALPENGMERWLIAGELRERPMTVRNRFHSRVMACVTTELELWLRQQSPPRGQVRCGEAGCRLRRNPDTTVGINVVYVFARGDGAAVRGYESDRRRSPAGRRDPVAQRHAGERRRSDSYPRTAAPSPLAKR